MTDEDAKRNRRLHKRHIVLLRPVEFETEAKHVHQAHISELSVFGCRLYTMANLQAGDRIALCLNDMDMVEANVKWREGRRVGCYFPIPISLDIITQMTLNSHS